MTEPKVRPRVHLAPVVQRIADANRQKRRALVKAVGIRQFKKIYRKAQV